MHERGWVVLGLVLRSKSRQVVRCQVEDHCQQCDRPPADHVGESSDGEGDEAAKAVPQANDRQCARVPYDAIEERGEADGDANLEAVSGSNVFM